MRKKVHTNVTCGRQAIHNPISSNIAFSSYAQIAKMTFSQQLVCPRQRHVFEQQYKRSWKDDGVLWCSVHITYTIHLNKAKKMFTGCVRVYDGRFYIYSFLDLSDSQSTKQTKKIHYSTTFLWAMFFLFFFNFVLYSRISIWLSCGFGLACFSHNLE